MLRLIPRATGAALATALISLSATQVASAADPLDPVSKAVPGEVIVRFEPGVDASERRDVRADADAEFDRGLPLPNTQVVNVDGSVAEAVRRLEAQDGVVYAEPNYIYTQTAAAPNDPRFGELWGLRNTGQIVDGAPGVAGVDIDALPAWDTTRGAGEVIAIVDGGTALAHPDIAPNLWTNSGEIPGNGTDDDLNGFKDDVHGWNFVDNNNDPDDQGTGHGTHTAGTAAAAAGNGTGVAGVAPQAEIMPIAGTGPDGSGSSDNLAKGILYAARNGATVINGSFGGAGKSLTMDAAITEARSRDVVVVVAAGNSNQNVDVTPSYPCAYTQPNLVCVAALDSDGSRASYSNYGPVSVDVGAPGTSVLSTSSFQTLFADDFSSPIAGRWQGGGTNNAWAAENGLLTDSPGGVNYKPNTNATLTMATPLNFTNRTGCGAAWRQWRKAAFDDSLQIGAVNGGGTETSFGGFTGSNSGFLNASQTLSAFEGNSSVRFRFTLLSNAINEADGVYIDDFGIKCRARPSDFDATSYMYLDGTSMASPHVAGAAALVRAANPGLTADQVAARLRSTAVPTPALVGLTTTGGRVDAARAITGQTTPPAQDPPVQPTPPSVAPPNTSVVTPPVPCAGLKATKLAACQLDRAVAQKCAMLKGSKLATCGKKVRALAACRALPAKGKKAKAKRAKCIAKANKIGKPKPKKKAKH